MHWVPEPSGETSTPSRSPGVGGAFLRNSQQGRLVHATQRGPGLGRMSQVALSLVFKERGQSLAVI